MGILMFIPMHRCSFERQQPPLVSCLCCTLASGCVGYAPTNCKHHYPWSLQNKLTALCNLHAADIVGGSHTTLHCEAAYTSCSDRAVLKRVVSSSIYLYTTAAYYLLPVVSTSARFPWCELCSIDDDCLHTTSARSQLKPNRYRS